MYKDPILKKYEDLITAAMPGVFSFIYHGDPVRIPATNLPALIISKVRTSVQPLTNSEDTHQIGIVITVVTDVREEKNEDQTITPGIAKLYDIIEGREESTYILKNNCILNILRTNIVVDAAYNLRTDLGTVTQADYGVTLGKRTSEGYAVEGQVEFLATYSQIR